MLAAYEITTQVDDGSEYGEIPYALSYDAEIIQRYQPKLKSGQWFSDSVNEIELVISENDYGWNVGDVVTLQVGAQETMIPVAAKVVGVLEDGAEVFGMFRSCDQSYGDIYKLTYDSFDFGAEGKPLLLFSYDAIAELEPMPIQSIYSTLLLSYPEGISSETLKQDQQTLSKMGCAFSMRLPEMDKNSKQYLAQQLYELLPIVVVLLILVLVSSISSSALATRRRLRDYATFYLCGMQWKQCAAVNFCQAVIAAVAAGILALFGLLPIKWTPLSESFLILWNGYLIAVLGGMFLLYLLFSMLMPLMMLHAASPPVKFSSRIKEAAMIQLKDVHKIYNPKKANEFEALKGVSLTIEDGEMVAVIGKTGAGKSTLLHILACIDSYELGEYLIDGTLVKNLSERRYAQIRNENIGMVMQDFALVDDFSAIENVRLPLDFAKKKKPNRKAIAMEALESVGMDGMAKKPVNKLSGGQKQRVAIARAIVNEPSVILADEPTGALDTKTAAEIMAVFKELNAQGKTIIIVTHDMGVAEQCDRIIEISDGFIV